jgi:predicted ribosomally synthesized peptide with nif11-like leader
MNQTLIDFRNAVNNSEALQQQVTAGADLVELGAANGFNFTADELNQGWQELQESDEGLTDFEMQVVAGGYRSGAGC